MDPSWWLEFFHHAVILYGSGSFTRLGNIWPVWLFLIYFWSFKDVWHCSRLFSICMNPFCAVELSQYGYYSISYLGLAGHSDRVFGTAPVFLANSVHRLI